MYATVRDHPSGVDVRAVAGRRSLVDSPLRYSGTTAEQSALAQLASGARLLLPFVGVMGAVLYAVLRLAYLFFYLQLRATPEEVGYGYAEVLASQLIGAIELVVLLGIAFWIASLGLRGMWRLAARRQGPATAFERAVHLSAVRLGMRCTVAAVVLVLVGLPVLAWNEGADAAQGFTVRNVYLYGTIRLPVLAVQAVPVTVSVLRSVQTDIATRPCLLYLGQANGNTVFYDVRSQESLRIPSGEIAIALQDTISVPVGC
jgi:hypothetical protein